MSGSPPADLRRIVREAIRNAADSAGFGEALPQADRVAVELPREFAHGDLASPVAFALAKALRRPPAEVAKEIAARISDPTIERVEVAGGGYLNFMFGPSIWAGLLARIEGEGARYGGGSAMAGERILVEFVSANPTGPLVVANARAASFGEALCRVLTAHGATVEREYLVNDAGSQVRNLAKSVEARWRQALGQVAELPADGYQGEYVLPITAAARDRFGDGLLDRPEEERLAVLRDFAVDRMLATQREDLGRLQVSYDRWFHERPLHDSGKVREALELLRSKGEIFEFEGAQWFRATKYGDEKDRVMIKKDGQPTYTLPDIAYHRDKFSRGYTRIVDIVGADHQVEMATLRAALGAIGEPVDRMEVIIIQFVSLKRGDEKVKMSKRSGDVVLLADLIEDVGADVARFFFLMRSPNSHLDFDLDLAKTQSQENPVYYLQYAHARMCGVIAKAREGGFAVPAAAVVDISLLVEPEARLVLRKLARWPLVVEKAALSRAPHLLTHELMELAQAVHQFYTQYRVVGAEPAGVQSARLALVAAAKQTIANGLALLGVSAPERMESKPKMEAE